MGVTCINILHTQHVITGVTNSLIKHSERVEVAQKASGGIPCGSCGVALTHNVLVLGDSGLAGTVHFARCRLTPVIYSCEHTTYSDYQVIFVTRIQFFCQPDFLMLKSIF